MCQCKSVCGGTRIIFVPGLEDDWKKGHLHVDSAHCAVYYYGGPGDKISG